MKVHKMLCLSMIVVLLSVCFFAAHASAQVKPIILRYSTMFPVNHKHAVLSEQWCKEVEKRTNGRVKVQHFPGGTLTMPPTTYESIVKDVTDIGLCVLGHTMGKFPISGRAGISARGSSGYAATKLANEYDAKFKPAEFDEVKVLDLCKRAGRSTYHQAGGQAGRHEGPQDHEPRPVTAFISNLGAAPVAMPMGDSYDAISRG